MLKNFAPEVQLNQGMVMGANNDVGNWASNEFRNAEFGDKRLTDRLISIADRFSEAPENPINQACNGWSETKGAYRFFQNNNVNASEILKTHSQQTVNRFHKESIVLAIQDTSYISWRHPKTTGLGVISRTPGKNVKLRESKGVVMHTCFTTTTDGLPLGILSQKIFARQNIDTELKNKKKRSHNVNIPIEDKESIRWLESLRKVNDLTKNTATKIVTVCDREGDFYELIELALKLGRSFVIRARGDKIINKKSRYSHKNAEHLWPYMQGLPVAGTLAVNVPANEKREARVANLSVRFGSFVLNPPRNNIRHQTEQLPDLNLNAVYIIEDNPPAQTEPLEWMLITDLNITNYQQAVEKVKWYCQRWKIEIFHKILKSGLKVEECRLGTADRLIKYLTVMSVIAWRIFWITLLSRANPNNLCTEILAEEEWKVLYLKVHKTTKLPNEVPKLKEAISWVAQLGGFLARKGDGEPGPIALWRGWKRLCDLSEGWSLANA